MHKTIPANKNQQWSSVSTYVYSFGKIMIRSLNLEFEQCVRRYRVVRSKRRILVYRAH